MRKPLKISSVQLTQVFLSLIEKKLVPVRARAYSTDIIRSHARGLIFDPNIEKELELMGLVEKELEGQES